MSLPTNGISWGGQGRQGRQGRQFNHAIPQINLDALLEEYLGAIVAFDRAIALNSNFVNAYYHRGYVYQLLFSQTLMVEVVRCHTLEHNQYQFALGSLK